VIGANVLRLRFQCLWGKMSGAMKALLVLTIIGFMFYGASNIMDEGGWWIHSHDTPTYISGNWMVGEFRQCTMGHSDSFELSLDCQQRGELDKWNKLFDGISPHVIPVRYHGKIERLDTTLFSWKCQRNESSVTCWALN
jgi:hypothetical protein